MWRRIWGKRGRPASLDLGRLKWTFVDALAGRVDGRLGHSFPARPDWPPGRFLLGPGKTPEPQTPRRPQATLFSQKNISTRLFPLHLHRPRHVCIPPNPPPRTVIMFRSAVVRSLRASVPRAVRAPLSVQIRSSPADRPSQFAPAFNTPAIRFYSAPAGLSKEEVEGRIVNLLKNFDKVRARCVRAFLIVVYGADKSISIGLRPQQGLWHLSCGIGLKVAGEEASNSGPRLTALRTSPMTLAWTVWTLLRS